MCAVEIRFVSGMASNLLPFQIVHTDLQPRETDKMLTTQTLFRTIFALIMCSVLAACSDAKAWPEKGQNTIQQMVSKNDFAFDCYHSEWAKNNAERLGDLSNLSILGTNSECSFDAAEITWSIFLDTVNGTIRCEMDGITGEYTISVFNNSDTPYGEYYCTAAHFPVEEDHPIGSVTDAIETWK